MKDPFRLKNLILKTLDMAGVLLEYGVKFAFNPHVAEEVQFRCPFHGKDNKPSARYYKRTQSAYCWVCMKKWDVIDFIMEWENMGFIRVLNYIISKYKIDVSSISDEPEFKKNNYTISDVNYKMIGLENKIKDLKHLISFEKYRLFCSAYYMIAYNLMQGQDISSDFERIINKLNIIRN